jgi:ABC-2 type transport system permease protein
MRYIFLVGWREFVENVKTKGFWLGLFLFPAIVILSGSIPVLLAKRGVPTRHFILLDFSGHYGELIRRELARVRDVELGDSLRTLARQGSRHEPLVAHFRGGGTNRSGARFGELDLAGWRAAAGTNWTTVPGWVPSRPALAEVRPPEALAGLQNPVEIAAALRPWLRGERRLPAPAGGDPVPLFAAVLIPEGYGPGSTNRLQYWAENQTEGDLRSLVQRQLSAEFRRLEYLRLGLDPAVIARIDALEAPLTQLNPHKAVGSEQVGMADTLRQWAPSLFVYLLWIAIFAVSQMLLNSVIEEKSNRIIEVLLSSVTPSELMLGKLAGVAAIGTVMMSCWIGTLVGLALFQVSQMSGGAMSGAAGAGAGLTQLPAEVISLLQGSWLLPGFAFYFLTGFILYATVFLTIGSLCNTLKEAQNFMAPLMLLLMVPLFLMPFIPRDPNGPIASIFSWIPIYTPFVMMNRITAHPPVVDVVGTAVLLVGFDLLVLWGCGRIFRLAILRTGQPPRILELLRWLRER